MEPDEFIELRIPNVLRDNILNEVGGVTSVKINKFTRTDTGRLDVEPIEYNKNEKSVVDNFDEAVTVLSVA